MWAFDHKADWDYIEHVCDVFRKNSENLEIIYVELVTSQDIRLQRNVTENRLANKASKRDVELSTQRLINDDNKYRCVSNDGELTFDNYIKIDNSNLEPSEVAILIKERFNL